MITHYVGIDIAYKTASIAFQDPARLPVTVLEIEQSPSAYQRLIRILQQIAAPDCTHVVMEATGTYWMALAHTLFAADFVVSVVNPAQPKYFAKLRGQRAKTDAIDALLLLDFARFCQPPPWTPPPAICETLRQHLTYRQQLIDIQTQLRNQLHAFQQNPLAAPALLQRMSRRLADLTAEIKALHAIIATLLNFDNVWRQATTYLLSIPGISTISAAWLLVATHCFERCDTPQQAAAFAGLAPHPKDSGKQHGQRSIGGCGHRYLRNVLYMASAPASRFNPILKVFYERLLARGTPKKVARCAVARKLIHIAWACVTKQQLFDPAYLQSRQFT